MRQKICRYKGRKIKLKFKGETAMQQDKEKTAGEDRRQQEADSLAWLDVVMFSVGLVMGAAAGFAIIHLSR